MANATIMPAAIAVARTVITLSRLWIILFFGMVGIVGVRWNLGLYISEPEIGDWNIVVSYLLETLAGLTVALMPRYFVRKYSIIQTACALLCVIAIGGIIVGDFLVERRENLTLYSVKCISGLLVILAELICLKRFFVIETSPLPDDSSNSTEEKINRFILGVLLFSTVIISAYTILSLDGVWIKYLNSVHMALTGCIILQYMGMWAASHSESVSLTSYPYPWRRIHKTFCALNVAVGIIGHHVILISIVFGIWLNGYPAEWLL